jgi:rare lipoprotein A
VRPVILGAAAVTLTALFAATAQAANQQCGRASWYQMGHTTANGDRMDPNRLAAAHPMLPFGTRVVVENLANGRSVEVVINDRGPFAHGRVIDLTRGAAEQIGMVEMGVAPVRLTIVGGTAELPGCNA